MTAKVAGSNPVNPPKSIADCEMRIADLIKQFSIRNSQSKWGRSTKAVRLIVDQEGASSSLVYPANVKAKSKSKKIKFESGFLTFTFLLLPYSRSVA